MENTPPIRVFLSEFQAGLFGYDLQICSPLATVGDYLDAVEHFQAQTMADCYGCDGCCHERVPLTLADFYFSAYHQGGGQSVAAWLAEIAAVPVFFGKALDLQLPRLANGACAFLNQQAKCCAAHNHRTFACRSHCCLPKSERAEALRAAIINTAEDELIRRLLAELAQNNAEDFLPNGRRLAGVSAADYAANAFSSLPAEAWRQAQLKQLVGAELWQQLTAAESVG